MPAPEERILVVLQEWVKKAENDLIAAGQILKLGKAAPMETICFHAQQCVEKYLKAVLVHKRIPVPKTHNVQTLMRMLPPSSRPDITRDEQNQLTNYAAVTRHPEAGLDISLAEARKAAAIARRVRRQIRRLLPRAAVRRKRK
jgi:HEPN domain-containing protein